VAGYGRENLKARGAAEREVVAGFGIENLKAGGAAACCFIW
jgi:hypothetical protein